MAYRYIGKGITDSNGVAHLTEDAEGNTVTGYTGVGAGEVDIVASCDDSSTISSSSLQSETYSLWDIIWYDKDSATWNVSNGSTSYSDNARSITFNSDSGLANPLVNNNSFFIPCTDDFIIEFDYGGGSMSLYCAVRGQISNMRVSLNYTRYNNKTIKLLVKPSEDKTDVYIDGVYFKTETNTRTFSGYDYCELRIRTHDSSGATGTFGNLKIYKA